MPGTRAWNVDFRIDGGLRLNAGDLAALPSKSVEGALRLSGGHLASLCRIVCETQTIDWRLEVVLSDFLGTEAHAIPGEVKSTLTIADAELPSQRRR